MVERIIREIPARQAPPWDEPGGRREKMVAADVSLSENLSMILGVFWFFFWTK